jgi:hypothetical protein
MEPSVENKGLLVAGVCKLLPSDQSKKIAAFAYDSGGGRGINDPFNDLLIAIVDQQKNMVVGSYSYKFYLGPGGIKEGDGLRIDTARYVLAPNVRAFALDITSGYSHHCGDGGVGAERTLYVQEGKNIRPILFIPAMSSWSYIEGNFECTTPPDSYVEIIENVNLAIELGTGKTNGYRNLVVTAVSSRSDGKHTGRKTFSYTLRYDGQQYPTEEMSKALEKWETRTRKP